MDCAFIVESVIRIFFEAFEILEEGIGNELANGVLHRPVPLRVEMRRANHVKDRLRFLARLLAENCR